MSADEGAWRPPAELTGVAELDFDRARRRGYPEAVYCEFKTPEQLRSIAAEVGRREARTIFTRASAEQATAVLDALPQAGHDPEARLLWWPAEPPQASGGLVVVAAAGTSDLPVAREAARSLAFAGYAAPIVADVGVAGLWRLMNRLDDIRRHAVVIAVAGMEGALGSVLAGLVDVPVVAVPTSVGYGASFEGLAPLLTMLNSCAEGMAVVNIDNGFGAGYLAAQINRLAGRRQ